jgi:hypothetical protein
MLLVIGLTFLIWRMESGEEPDIPDIVAARGALLEHSDEIMRSSNNHPLPIRVQVRSRLHSHFATLYLGRLTDLFVGRPWSRSPTLPMCVAVAE